MTKLIYSAAALRAMAISMAGTMLAVYLTTLQFNPFTIGIAVALGLAGCAVATLLSSLVADRWGRRKTLIAVSLLMCVGGLALSISQAHTIIYLALFFGMINGMGRDRGAGLTMDQAMLPNLTDEKNRTQTFAWYNLTVDGGNAVGALLGIVPALLRNKLSFSAFSSYQSSWLIYSSLCLAATLVILFLNQKVELQGEYKPKTLSPESKKIVTKFALISGLDSLGGGFLSSVLLGYWFFKRFGVDESVMAPLFFAARILNAFSHLGAAWLAKRIGLVNTMVFTHLPSSLLLMTVPFTPTLSIAIILFLIRESLVEMDVPTRQSYIIAVVKPEERTLAAGISNLSRNIAWAIAPGIGGTLMKFVSYSAPLWIGPGIKVGYDVLLYREFQHIRPPEE